MYSIPSFSFQHCLRISKLALPLVLTQSLQMTLGLVDTFVAGQLGTSALAALALANGVFWAVVFVCFGLLTGVETFAARAAGAKDQHGGFQILGQGVWLALGLSLLAAITLVGIFNIYDLFGVDASLMQSAWSFLGHIMPGLPFIFLFTVLQLYWKAQGVVKPWFWLMILLNILNLIFDLLFAHGVWGFSLGVDGIALSTSLCRLIAFTVILMYTLKALSLQKIFAGVLPALAFDLVQFKKLLFFGLPSLGFAFVDILAFQLIALAAAQFGAVALAAHQIIFMLLCFGLMFASGWSQAQSILFGQMYGRQKIQQAFEESRVHLLFGLILMTLLSLIILGSYKTLLSWFSADSTVLSQLYPIMLIFIAAFLFDALQLLLSGLVTAAGETKRLFRAGLMAHYCVGLPTGFYCAFVLEWGLYGLWVGILTAIIGLFVLNLRAYAKETHKALDHHCSKEPKVRNLSQTKDCL